MTLRFRFTIILFALAATVLASGCRSFRGDDFPYHVARFYIEISERFPDSHRETVTLPYTERTINIDPRATIAEWDIARAEVFEAEIGSAMAFYMMNDAARHLQFLTYNNQGRRIVLILNGHPVGSTIIHRGIDNGILTMYLEVPDEDLEDIAEYVTKTSEAARRRM